MRLALTLLAVLLLVGAFASSAHAQAMIPYRRTIPVLRDQPHEFTGRYVRINVAATQSNLGSSSTASLTLQPIINVPGSSAGGLVNGNGMASGGGNGFGALGAAGAVGAPGIRRPSVSGASMA